MRAEDIFIREDLRAVTDQQTEWDDTNRLRLALQYLVYIFIISITIPSRSSDEIIWIQKLSLETCTNGIHTQPMNLLAVHLLQLQPYNGHTLDNSFLLP